MERGKMIKQEVDKLYSRFKEKAEGVSAQVYRVATVQDVNGLLVRLLGELGSKKVVISHSSLSRECQLDDALASGGFEVYTSDLRREAPTADAGISQLDLAVAETGSLAQDATNVDSRLVSTLPLIHVALVPTSGLSSTLEDALFSLYSSGRVPGYVSFITGPSRTSDIERVLTIGVHGPEKLFIVFVDQGG